MGEAIVGRVNERALLESVLASGAGTITVVGPPGIGKTRLVRDHFERSAGAWESAAWVDVGDASSDVLSQITEAIGLSSVAATLDRPDHWLADALSSRDSMLLVLDGADGAHAPIADLTATLAERPEGPQIIVTCRQVLGRRHETLVEVGPLSSDEASVLFRQAASRLAPQLFVGEDAPRDRAVQEVVDLVGRNPRALEVAASRLRVMGLDELRQRLEEDLRVVADDGGLWSVVESAVKRLQPDELHALAQCTVFPNTFDLAAAEQVLSTQGARSTAQLLTALRNQSMLVAEGEHRARLSVPAFVRPLAHAQLSDTERAQAEERHADHYLTMLGETARELATTGARRAAERLVDERSNLESLRQRAEARGDAPRAVAAATILAEEAFDDRPADVGAWLALELIGEAERTGASPTVITTARLWAGRAALERLDAGTAHAALDALDDNALADDDYRGQRAMLASALAWREARFDDAAGAARAAEEHVTGIGRPELEAAAALHLARALRMQGELAAAGPVIRAALHSMRLHHERPIGEGHALFERALLARAEGDLDQASFALADASAVFETAACTRHAVRATTELAWVLQTVGRLEEALARHRVATQQARAFGLGPELALPLIGLGACLEEHGDKEGSLAAWREARTIATRGERPRTAQLADALLGSRVDDVAPELLQSGGEDLGDALTDLRTASDEPPSAPGMIVAFLRRRRRDTAPRTPTASASEAERLVVTTDGGAVRLVPAAWATLPPRSPVRRVLTALVEARIDHPGRPRSIAQLVDAGWPDERILPNAARNRLYMAMSKLRSLGLDAVILRNSEGYYLDPAVPVERVETSDAT